MRHAKRNYKKDIGHMDTVGRIDSQGATLFKKIDKKNINFLDVPIFAHYMIMHCKL